MTLLRVRDPNGGLLIEVSSLRKDGRGKDLKRLPGTRQQTRVTRMTRITLIIRITYYFSYSYSIPQHPDSAPPFDR